METILQRVIIWGSASNRIRRWAERSDISMFIWMTLPPSKILRTKKRTRVIVTNIISSVEAVFCIPLVTAFTAAAMVGMGRVVVVGMGSTHTVPVSSSNTLP